MCILVSKGFFFFSFEHRNADPQTKSKQFKIQIIIITTVVISKYTSTDLAQNSSQIKKKLLHGAHIHQPFERLTT